MKHNFGNLPEPPYTHSEDLHDLSREELEEYCNQILIHINNTTVELQQLDLEKWCVDHGFGKLQAIVLCKFVEDEFFGENQT